MKRCPKCGQSYADPNLNFCLNDGELLRSHGSEGRREEVSPDEPPPTKFADDDSPPTLVMDSPRTTNPIGWASSSPPGASEGQQIITPPGHYPVQYGNFSSPNQVLGILSLVMGGLSVTLGWCCYTGVLFGPAGIILGIIALLQNKSDPERYGGRGMAIAGIVLGALYLVGIVLFILLYGLASFLSMAS